MMQKQIDRKQLIHVTMDHRTVSSVDVRQITFEPGQETGKHTHPCPVVGYIARGAALLQVEGKQVQELPEGSAFYEPADTVILRFDNASATESPVFIANYLLDGEKDLIHMLSVGALQ
jgi:quercetin dioxygenase-like cupin family protein